MDRILCFGDSNTFGFNPKDGSRYNINERWSGILKENVKKSYELIEAGCNNRTGFYNNPSGNEQSGLKVFPDYLKKYNPDIIILAIGINDLQFQYNSSNQDIEAGLEKYLNLINDKKFILLIPSIIEKNILKSFFAQMFDDTSIEKSKELHIIYKTFAIKNNITYIDLNQIVKPSSIDGLHYDIEMHKIIAQSILKVL